MLVAKPILDGYLTLVWEGFTNSNMNVDNQFEELYRQLVDENRDQYQDADDADENEDLENEQGDVHLFLEDIAKDRECPLESSGSDSESTSDSSNSSGRNTSETFDSDEQDDFDDLDDDNPGHTKQHALVSVTMPQEIGGGKINFYRGGDFYAICSECDHGKRCRKVRTAKYSKTKRGQGRPLGYLCAWLARGDEHSCAIEHKLLVGKIPYADREYFRALLHSVPGAQELFEYERKKLDDEFEEPEECP